MCQSIDIMYIYIIKKWTSFSLNNIVHPFMKIATCILYKGMRKEFYLIFWYELRAILPSATL